MFKISALVLGDGVREEHVCKSGTKSQVKFSSWQSPFVCIRSSPGLSAVVLSRTTVVDSRRENDTTRGSSVKCSDKISITFYFLNFSAKDTRIGVSLPRVRFGEKTARNRRKPVYFVKRTILVSYIHETQSLNFLPDEKFPRRERTFPGHYCTHSVAIFCLE